MYDAGPKHWASDEAFVPIFADRSYAHLRIVFDEFEQIADMEIDKVVGKELHGDVGHLLENLGINRKLKTNDRNVDGLSFDFLFLVKFTKGKNAYFAEILHNSLKGGIHTNHKRLIRTIVSPLRKRFGDDQGEIRTYVP